MLEEDKSIGQESLDAKLYFEQYWRYCSSLRNWFVAYGIGGSVLLLTDKATIFEQIGKKEKSLVLIFFVVGVVSQIVLAFINKVIHWYIYWGSEDEEFVKKLRYKVSDYLSECFWIDVVTDLITFASFGLATILVIIALFCEAA